MQVLKTARARRFASLVGPALAALVIPAAASAQTAIQNDFEDGTLQAGFPAAAASC